MTLEQALVIYLRLKENEETLDWYPNRKIWLEAREVIFSEADKQIKVILDASPSS